MKPFLTPEDWEEIYENPQAYRLYRLGMLHGVASILFGQVIVEILVSLYFYLQR